MLNALNNMIDQLVQAARNHQVYRVEIVCEDRTLEFSFNNYDDALDETSRWYRSGYAKRMDIFNRFGTTLYTCLCSVTNRNVAAQTNCIKPAGPDAQPM